MIDLNIVYMILKIYFWFTFIPFMIFIWGEYTFDYYNIILKENRPPYRYILYSYFLQSMVPFKAQKDAFRMFLSSIFICLYPQVREQVRSIMNDVQKMEEYQDKNFDESEEEDDDNEYDENYGAGK